MKSSRNACGSSSSPPENLNGLLITLFIVAVAKLLQSKVFNLSLHMMGVPSMYFYLFENRKTNHLSIKT
jgi:hypothetical protein